MKTKKLTITKEVEKFDSYELDGSLSRAIEYLLNLQEKYNGKKIRIEHVYDDYKEDRFVTFYLYEDREETDEEFAKRIARLEKEQKKAETKERKQLKELKEKYEN